MGIHQTIIKRRNAVLGLQGIIELSYTSTIELNVRIGTLSGNPWMIDWGDGVWETYPSDFFTFRLKTFATPTAGVARIKVVNRPTTDISQFVSTVGSWNFDIEKLSPVRGTILFNSQFSGNHMAIFGDVASVSHLTGSFTAYGTQMAVSGNIDNFTNLNGALILIGNLITVNGTVNLPNLTAQMYLISEAMNLSIDIAGYKHLTLALVVIGSNINTTYTSSTWTTLPSVVTNIRPMAGQLTQTQIDNLLNDMNAANTTGTATIDLRFNNAPPSLASYNAIIELQDRGYTVLTNAMPISPVLQRVLDYADANSITKPSVVTLTILNLYTHALVDSGVLSYTGTPSSASDFSVSDVFVNFPYNDVNLQEFAKIDWIRLIQVEVFGGMTYTAYGYEGNGVDGYVNTKYNPATQAVNYALNDAARLPILYKEATSDVNDQAIDGMNTDGANMSFNRISTAHKINHIAGSLSPGANLTGIGLKAIIRDNANDLRFVNNAIQESRTAASTGVTSEEQWLLRRFIRYGNAGISVYAMSKSVTFQQTQSYINSTNQYLKAIGLTPVS